MSKFIEGQKVVIDAPGYHRKHGCVGVVSDGPGTFLGNWTVSFDGDVYGFATHELIPLTDRLEALRATLRTENISMGELVELQGYGPHIDESDVELREAAGMPEFPEDEAEHAEYDRTVCVNCGGTFAELSEYYMCDVCGPAYA